MTILKRQFYRSGRGPSPTDEDLWTLVFDRSTLRLSIRHSWQTKGHSGFNEFALDEFLAQQGSPREALIALLFDKENGLE